MIQFDECHISQLSIARIGSGNEPKIISETIVECSEPDEQDLLKKLLLKPFVGHTTSYEFAHDIDIEYNVLFGLAKNLYNEQNFEQECKKIAQHLLSVSKHPNIKEGDLFIAHFTDLQLGNKHFQALGIYKYEDKENYIETIAGGKNLDIQFRKGLSSKKADKACLIIFTEEPYTLLIIDSNSKETEYWQTDFIKQKPKNDYINNTTDFLTLAKNFITDQIPNEYEVSKTDQIDLLKRSVNYFKEHENFDRAEFESEVFEDKSIIKSFRQFDETWQQEHNLDIADNFEISSQAVKKQARVFKSILKLDKNFHIYIHGDRDLIEQGTDPDGRKFYKIYYDNES